MKASERPYSRRKSFVDRLMEEGAVPGPQPRFVSSVSMSLRGDDLSKYDDYPLAQSLLRYQDKRIRSLKNEGKHQVYYPKSTAGWIATLFMIKGRALDWMSLPFVISVIHAFIYTVIQETIVKRTSSDGGFFLNFGLLGGDDGDQNSNDDGGSSGDVDVDATGGDGRRFLEDMMNNEDTTTGEVKEDCDDDSDGMSDILFALVLNTTLSGLLVFRLNRAQNHFWLARGFWGRVVESGRSLVGSLVAHANHNLMERDHAVRWLAAFSLSVMELIRGTGVFPVDHFAGLLTQEEMSELADNTHPPVYAANRVRMHLKSIFDVDETTSPALAHAMIRHLDACERDLNDMLDGCGGLQRIRSTPLPIVCVSHLRTLLMVSIILLPYIWGPQWGWRTVPIVIIAAFAWFGIEGTSAEIESPFREDRVNALNQDGYCIGLLQTIQQQIVNHADHDMKVRAAKAEMNGSFHVEH